MTVVVSLRDLNDELQTLPNEGTAYLNKITGRIIAIADDDVAMVEMDSEFDWFKYRDEAYKEIAIAWLESKGIAYADDMNRREQSA